MQKFTFEINNSPAAQIFFNVVANSPAEAVTIANEALSDASENESESLYIGSGIYDAHLVFKPNVQVDETMIVNQEDVPVEDLTKAFDFLTAKGFSFDEGFERLFEYHNPIFNKPLFTEDGNYIYAILKVSGRFDFNINRFNFHIEAILYPVGLSQLTEDGTLHYAVHFRDRQAFTTADNLPNTLALYEEKFMELITALRKADPFDGIPLPDDELK
jgi:hypothetical protein